jgi:peptidoglycan hydrolase CwlO-like protein
MDKSIVSQGTEQGGTRLKKGKSRSRRIWFNIIIMLLSVAVWTAAMYYGYTYAKGYIDTAIRNVQQENALNIQELTNRIEIMTQEIGNLKESIEDADSTISSSRSVQKRIDRKLEELDERLQELQESLEILKEAPNVQN